MNERNDRSQTGTAIHKAAKKLAYRVHSPSGRNGATSESHPDTNPAQAVAERSLNNPHVVLCCPNRLMSRPNVGTLPMPGTTRLCCPKCQITVQVTMQAVEEGPADSAHDDSPQGRVGQSDCELACSDRFHFDARVNKRRTMILINGKAHPIPNKTFATMLRLAVGLVDGEDGWVSGREFGEYPQHVISNARKDVHHLLSRPNAELFENNSFGSYRLSVSAGNVTFNWNNIRAHWDGQIKTLTKFALDSVGAPMSS